MGKSLNAAATYTAAKDVKLHSLHVPTARLLGPPTRRARSADSQHQKLGPPRSHPPRDNRQEAMPTAGPQRGKYLVYKWTTPSGPVLDEFFHDFHSKELQGLHLNLGESVNALPLVFPLPEIQDTPSYSASTAMSVVNNDSLNGLVITPPPTANPNAIPVDSSEYRNRGCGCIGSLADILERISGDGGNDIDEADRFDDLLVYLRDGVETCKQVLPCKHCSVCTTNSMFVVTIIQQLATISSNLCRQLLMYQQKVKTTSTVNGPPLLLSADIYVGNYQVRAAALHLWVLFPIVSMHLKDLQQLLESLQNDLKKGTKAFKLLNAATDAVQTASTNLQIASNRQTQTLR
ncbi:MAG: hypothetical protein Q9225_001713 [Loekoesia sp. 1 TL-2023]